MHSTGCLLKSGNDVFLSYLTTNLLSASDCLSCSAFIGIATDGFNEVSFHFRPERDFFVVVHGGVLMPH